MPEPRRRGWPPPVPVQRLAAGRWTTPDGRFILRRYDRGWVVMTTDAAGEPVTVVLRATTLLDARVQLADALHDRA